MKQYSFPLGSILLSALFLGVGLALGLSVDHSWFGRFGAVVVLFGVISEYALIQNELSALYSALKGQGAAECGNLGMPDLSPSVMHKWLALGSHLMIVLGTLIWGFGDWVLPWVLSNA